MKKARNIVRNNMESLHVQYVTVTATNAHMFIRANQVFQASRLEAKHQREAMRHAYNKALAISRKQKA
jgi:uncharacterized protein YtpQ (UPF0354 family)